MAVGAVGLERLGELDREELLAIAAELAEVRAESEVHERVAVRKHLDVALTVCQQRRIVREGADERDPVALVVDP